MASIFKRFLGDNDQSPTSAPAANGGQPKVKPIEVTDADFEQVVLQSDKPVIVDLWAEWCQPCHMIAPSVEKLAADYEGQALVTKLNIDENQNTPMRYGIRGIPTLLFFKDGKEVDRQVGVAGYVQLAGKLERLLA